MRGHASTASGCRTSTILRADLGADRRSPASLLDLGCGLGPLALPWMGLAAPPPTTPSTSTAGRSTWSTPSSTWSGSRTGRGTRRRRGPAHRSDGDVALLLKLVPLLDRQDPATAAARLLRGLDRATRSSVPARSLGGRRRGMEATYRDRLTELVADARVRQVAEASVPNELVFVLTLDG